MQRIVAGFLPHQPLLNPFGAATLLLPRLAGAGERPGGVGHFLHPLVADLGQPKLDRFGLGTGNALDEAQKGFSRGRVGEITFAVGGGQFQLVTICNQLTSLLVESVLQDFPVILGQLVIRLLRQHLNDVHDGKPPSLRRFVVMAADLMTFKNGEVFVHGCAVGNVRASPATAR